MTPTQITTICRAANALDAPFPNDAPFRLDPTASHRALLEWLQWCDPNGCHTQELFELEYPGEGESYADLDSAWQAIAEMCEVQL